jgi:single-stranded-DNA-specific exonuclease
MAELKPRYHWVVPPAHALSASTVEEARRRGLSARALRVLSRRGPVDAAELSSRFDEPGAGLHDPRLLPDADAVVRRVDRAGRTGESILVLGDFDADGLTGLAILVEALRWLGLEAEPYVPHRTAEGHGLSMAAVERAKDAGRGLIMTADTGSTSLAEVAAARQAGIDVIVTDHHVLGPEWPDALAVVNLQRPDSRYPDRRLSGAGVAFKVAQLLMAERPGGAEASLGLVDLAAIGSVADVVPITGENRAIVRLGLRRLSEAPRPGLAALLAAARLDTDDLSRDDIAFGLAPRINAMGRIGDPAVAAALLLARDDAEAAVLAAQLEAANVQRRAMTATAIADARASLDGATDDAFIVLEGDWPVGIIGLVAGRLAEETGRPVLVLSNAVSPWRGSARSAGGVDVAAALEACHDLLERHGGHPAAAGCHVDAAHVPELRSRLADFAAGQPASDRRPTLAIDLVQSALEADYVLLRELAPLEDAAEAPPLVGVAGLVVVRARVASGGHTQLTLRRGRDVVDGISFGRADLAEQLREGLEIDVVARLTSRTFAGLETLQLEVRDAAVAGTLSGLRAAVTAASRDAVTAASPAAPVSRSVQA